MEWNGIESIDRPTFKCLVFGKGGKTAEKKMLRFILSFIDWLNIHN